jgi:hypothetical protein
MPRISYRADVPAIAGQMMQIDIQHGRTVVTMSRTAGQNERALTVREVANTMKSGPDTEETKTTLSRADGNGGFDTLRQTHEVAKHNADNSVEVKKTMLIPDGTETRKFAK